MIHLVIVDDDKLVADLLADLLSIEGNIVVDKVVLSGNLLLNYLKESKNLPDVILLDLKNE